MVPFVVEPKPIGLGSWRWHQKPALVETLRWKINTRLETAANDAQLMPRWYWKWARLERGRECQKFLCPESRIQRVYKVEYITSCRRLIADATILILLYKFLCYCSIWKFGRFKMTLIHKMLTFIIYWILWSGCVHDAINQIDFQFVNFDLIFSLPKPLNTF